MALVHRRRRAAASAKQAGGSRCSNPASPTASRENRLERSPQSRVRWDMALRSTPVSLIFLEPQVCSSGLASVNWPRGDGGERATKGEGLESVVRCGDTSRRESLCQTRLSGRSRITLHAPLAQLGRAPAVPEGDRVAGRLRPVRSVSEPGHAGGRSPSRERGNTRGSSPAGGAASTTHASAGRTAYERNGPGRWSRTLALVGARWRGAIGCRPLPDAYGRCKAAKPLNQRRWFESTVGRRFR